MTVKQETRVRREQIVAAALELVGDEGPAGLGVARIAERVGLVPSAIYRHFPGKDAIVEALLDLIAARLDESVKLAQADPDAMAGLAALLERHVALVCEHRGVPRVVFSAEVHEGAPDRRRRVHRLVRAYLRGVERAVRKGQAAGTIRRDLDPAGIASLFLGIVQPAAVLSSTSDGRYDVKRHAARAWSVLADAIGVER